MAAQDQYATGGGNANRGRAEVRAVAKGRAKALPLLESAKRVDCSLCCKFAHVKDSSNHADPDCQGEEGRQEGRGYDACSSPANRRCCLSCGCQPKGMAK